MDAVDNIWSGFEPRLARREEENIKGLKLHYAIFFSFSFSFFINFILLPLRVFSILESRQKFVCFSGMIGKLVGYGVLLKIVSFFGPFLFFSYIFLSGLVWDGGFTLLN